MPTLVWFGQNQCLWRQNGDMACQGILTFFKSKNWGCLKSYVTSLYSLPTAVLLATSRLVPVCSRLRRVQSNCAMTLMCVLFWFEYRGPSSKWDIRSDRSQGFCVECLSPAVYWPTIDERNCRGIEIGAWNFHLYLNDKVPVRHKDLQTKDVVSSPYILVYSITLLFAQSFYDIGEKRLFRFKAIGSILNDDHKK